MYDVYLCGNSDSSWRDEFKNNISTDIVVFDPTEHKIEDISSAIAKDLHCIEECKIIAFNILQDKQPNIHDIIPIVTILGDCVGRGLQVIVCLNVDDFDFQYIAKYLEYYGVYVVNSVDDLISATEETIAQIELCEADEDILDV